MLANPKIYITPAEYLATKRACAFKSEYWDGEVHALASISESHNLITTNVTSTLGVQLRRRPGKVYPSAMRLKISQTGLYTYADGVVVCDQPQFEEEENDTLLNPTVLIEVFTASTENYDRVRKFENYRRLDSLCEYLLIAQDHPHIEHYVRQADN